MSPCRRRRSPRSAPAGRKKRPSATTWLKGVPSLRVGPAGTDRLRPAYLIPIPPLDGSRVLMGLLPYNLSEKYALIEPYSFFLLMGLIWFNVIGNIIWPIAGFILNLLGIYNSG